MKLCLCVCLVGSLREDCCAPVITGRAGRNVWQEHQGHVLLCSRAELLWVCVVMEVWSYADLRLLHTGSVFVIQNCQTSNSKYSVTFCQS